VDGKRFGEGIVKEFPIILELDGSAKVNFGLKQYLDCASKIPDRRQRISH
jgi:hypothetical protein